MVITVRKLDSYILINRFKPWAKNKKCFNNYHHIMHILPIIAEKKLVENRDIGVTKLFKSMNSNKFHLNYERWSDLIGRAKTPNNPVSAIIKSENFPHSRPKVESHKFHTLFYHRVSFVIPSTSGSQRKEANVTMLLTRDKFFSLKTNFLSLSQRRRPVRFV